VRSVANCCAIGLSSDDATNARLIFRALAIRRLRSAGLTYFFFPLGLVADRRAFDVFEEALFFVVLRSLTDSGFFFLWLAVDAVAFVDLEFGAS
jgi:hypothetical protein